MQVTTPVESLNDVVVGLPSEDPEVLIGVFTAHMGNDGKIGEHLVEFSLFSLAELTMNQR